MTARRQTTAIGTAVLGGSLLLGGLAAPATAAGAGVGAPTSVGAGAVTGEKSADAVRTLERRARTPKVSLRNVTVEEPTGAEADATVRAVLNRKVRRNVVVRYRTVGGSAVAGEDFTEKRGRAVIRKGKKRALIKVSVLGDDVVEDTENLRVKITKVKGAKIGKRSGRLSILDDDTTAGPGTDGGGDGGDGGTTPLPTLGGLPLELPVIEGLPFELPLSLSSLPGSPVEVLWQIIPGSADTADFPSLTGTSAFAPGELLKTVSIPTVDDAFVEPTETATLLVTVISGALPPALTTVPLSILDNDGGTGGGGGLGGLPVLGMGDSLPTDLGGLLGGSLPIPLSLDEAADSDVTGVLTATVSTLTGDLPLASVPFTIPQGSLSPLGGLGLPLGNLPVGADTITFTITQLTGATSGDLTRTLPIPGPAALPALSLGTLPGSLTGLLGGSLPVPISLDQAAPQQVTGVLTATLTTLLGPASLASIPFTIPQGATSPTGLALPLTSLPVGLTGLTLTVTDLVGATPVGSLTRTVPLL